MQSVGLKIVHMGDSITFGQYVDPQLRWTTLVGKWLQSTLNADGIHVESINSGVSGNTTRMALERFPQDIQVHQPHIATIQFGLNDCNCWDTDGGHPRVSAAAFQANLREMIARVRIFGCQRIILANNHPTLRRAPMCNGEVYEAANRRYSQLLEYIASECGVVFCDVRRAFSGFDDRQLAELLLPAPDILHLSVAGNQIYAEAIFPYIEAAVQQWTRQTLHERSAA